jgi:hypothetical protein
MENNKAAHALEMARKAAEARDAAITALRAIPVRTDTMYLTAAAKGQKDLAQEVGQ